MSAKTVILTSSLGCFPKVDGQRIPAVLYEANGLLAKLRSLWPDRAKVLLICGSPDNREKNDGVLSCLRRSFELSGLPWSRFELCDGRNTEAADAILDTDVVILAGGHVPTQNAFMRRIGLKEKLASFGGLVIAWSAGSMNAAGTVYAGPELPGEALDPAFRRWIPGLGLTDVNIFPHYEALRDDVLDGQRLVEDITFADSMGHEILALNDGSYIVIDETGETLFGEAYRILDGVLEPVCADGASVRLPLSR